MTIQNWKARRATHRDSARRTAFREPKRCDGHHAEEVAKRTFSERGSAPNPGILRFGARIPGQGGGLRSHIRNPGPGVGARGCVSQCPALRSGPLNLPGIQRYKLCGRLQWRRKTHKHHAKFSADASTEFTARLVYAELKFHRVPLLLATI